MGSMSVRGFNLSGSERAALCGRNFFLDLVVLAGHLFQHGSDRFERKLSESLRLFTCATNVVLLTLILLKHKILFPWLFIYFPKCTNAFK